MTHRYRDYPSLASRTVDVDATMFFFFVELFDKSIYENARLSILEMIIDRHLFSLAHGSCIITFELLMYFFGGGDSRTSLQCLRVRTHARDAHRHGLLYFLTATLNSFDRQPPSVYR